MPVGSQSGPHTKKAGRDRRNGKTTADWLAVLTYEASQDEYICSPTTRILKVYTEVIMGLSCIQSRWSQRHITPSRLRP